MKKWKLFLLLISFYCIFSIKTQAQLIPNANPNNIGDVTDQIFNLHGGQIDLTYAEVYDFIDNLLPQRSGYDPSTPSPVAEMDDVTSTTVSYTWAPVPGVYGYQASFLELAPPSGSSPETGSTTVTVPEVEFTVSNGLLLTVFQSKQTPTSVGEIDIIIVEKPVFFAEVTDDCKCNHIGKTESKKFGLQGQSDSDIGNNYENEFVDFDYSHSPNTIGYYSMTITYTNGTTSNVIVEIEINGEDKIEVTLVCRDNIAIGEGRSMLYSNALSDAPMGSITFSEGMDFHSINNSSGTVELAECYDKKSNSSNPRGKKVSNDSQKEILLSASPNPAKNTIRIVIPEHLDIIPQNLLLVDALGRPFTLHADHYQQELGALNINISQIPSGIYNLHIQNKNIAMKTRFIKIE